MNRASPIPIGARKVALCFSAASMKMQKMSSAVSSVSMNRPRVMEVPLLRLVRTVMGPGKSPDTTAAAVMAPRTCAMMRTTALNHPIAPIKARATVTYACELMLDDYEAGTYCRVEQATTDAEEDPNVDGQRETKGQGNV
jgi:hypothetical protein